MYIYKTNILHTSYTIAKHIGYPNQYNNHNQITSQHPGAVFSPKLDHLVHLYPNPTLAIINIRNEKKGGKNVETTTV